MLRDLLLIQTSSPFTPSPVPFIQTLNACHDVAAAAAEGLRHPDIQPTHAFWLAPPKISAGGYAQVKFGTSLDVPNVTDRAGVAGCGPHFQAYEYYRCDLTSRL